MKLIINNAGFHNVYVEAEIIEINEFEYPEGCQNTQILISKKDFTHITKELCGMKSFDSGGCTCGSKLPFFEEEERGVWFDTHPDNVRK